MSLFAVRYDILVTVFVETPPSKFPYQAEMDALNRATAEMLDKSDRVRVVLLGAELDRILTEALRAFLIPADSKKDILLDSNSTFSTRIELGYRVGFLKPEWVHDMRILNQIRDDFAHGQAGLHLGASPHRERCFQLIIGEKWMDAGGYGGSEGDNGPTRFVSTVTVLAAHLLLIRTELSGIEERWRKFKSSVVVDGGAGDMEM